MFLFLLLFICFHDIIYSTFNWRNLVFFFFSFWHIRFFSSINQSSKAKMMSLLLLCTKWQITFWCNYLKKFQEQTAILLQFSMLNFISSLLKTFEKTNKKMRSLSCFFRSSIYGSFVHFLFKFQLKKINKWCFFIKLYKCSFYYHWDKNYLNWRIKG